MAGSRTDQEPWDRRIGTLALLIVGHLLLAVLILPQLPARDGYLDRYQVLHEARGRPYRDFEVEYPPVLIIVVDAVAGDTESATAWRLVFLSLAAEAALVLLLYLDRGRETATRYLALTLPLVPFFVATLDIVSVTLCVSSVVLCRLNRERVGGTIFALAILTKVWPIVLVPGLLVTGHRRALRWCLAALISGMIAWIVWGGVSGPWQVISARGAPGWEIESTIGSIVWALGGHVAYVQDSPPFISLRNMDRSVGRGGRSRRAVVPPVAVHHDLHRPFHARPQSRNASLVHLDGAPGTERPCSHRRRPILGADGTTHPRTKTAPSESS